MKHPLFRGILAVAAFILVAEILVGMMSLAWSVTIPITEHITINLGDLPQWIIALVAAGGLWKAYKAEKKIGQVAVQIDGLLTERDKAKVREGEAKGLQTGADTAATLLEGQRQGIATERAGVAAHAATANGAPAGVEAGKPPLPVADEKTAAAVDRVVDAIVENDDAAKKD